MVSGIGEGVESIVFIGLEVVYNLVVECNIEPFDVLVGECVGSSWLNMMMMVVVLFVSLRAIRAQWIASEVDLWLEGWVRPMPSHFA